MGNILQTIGDYENAYNAFRHAQEIYPEYKYNYLNLANIEYFRKNYKNATEFYNAFLGAYPEHMEANYDEAALARGPYPPMLKRRIAGNNGHLSNSDCADCAVYAAKNGVKYVVLGHLSKENNSPKLAYDTVHRRLMDAGFIPGVDVMLQVAPRSEPGQVYELRGECAKCEK